MAHAHASFYAADVTVIRNTSQEIQINAGGIDMRLNDEEAKQLIIDLQAELAGVEVAA